MTSEFLEKIMIHINFSNLSPIIQAQYELWIWALHHYITSFRILISWNEVFNLSSTKRVCPNKHTSMISIIPAPWSEMFIHSFSYKLRWPTLPTL